MTAWNNLNMKQRAELMKIYLQNGITSLSEMKEHYNEYAAGGHMYQTGGGEGDGLPLIKPYVSPYTTSYSNYTSLRDQLNNTNVSDKTAVKQPITKTQTVSSIYRNKKKAEARQGAISQSDKTAQQIKDIPNNFSQKDWSIGNIAIGRYLDNLNNTVQDFDKTFSSSSLGDFGNPFNYIPEYWYIKGAAKLAADDPSGALDIALTAGDKLVKPILNSAGKIKPILNDAYENIVTPIKNIRDNKKFMSDFNNWTDLYGYPHIEQSRFNTKAINKQAKKIINRHNTFVRGVRIPGNLDNVLAKMKRKGIINPTEEEIAEYMLTHPSYDTGWGRAGLGDIADLLGIPKRYLVSNYSSNSFETAKGYALNNRNSLLNGDKDGYIGLVRRPTKFGRDRLSWIKDNEFELLNTDDLWRLGHGAESFPTSSFLGFPDPFIKEWERKGLDSLRESLWNPHYKVTRYYVGERNNLIKRAEKDLRNYINARIPGDVDNTNQLQTIKKINQHIRDLKKLKLDPYTSNNIYDVIAARSYIDEAIDYPLPAYYDFSYRDFIKNEYKQPSQYRLTHTPNPDGLPVYFTTERPTKGRYQHFIDVDVDENQKLYDLLYMYKPEPDGSTYTRAHEGAADPRLSLKDVKFRN